MAIIRPFRALSYNQDRIPDLATVITPPYDVISESQGLQFVAASDYSMALLDLPKGVGSERFSESRYREPANLVARWRKEHILVEDTEPAMFLQETTFALPGKGMCTRQGLIALVRLCEFSEGTILPHEATFPAVVEDRVRLLAACQVQFSQIFSIYSDPDNEILAAAAKATTTAVADVLEPSGTRHVLYRLGDPTAIAAITAGFAVKTLYIADGHHRYTTALTYSRSQVAQEHLLQGEDGCLYTMMYLTPMEQEGLQILPTHRLLQFQLPLNLEKLRNELMPMFTMVEVEPDATEMATGKMLNLGSPDKTSETGLPSFLLFLAAVDRWFLLTLRPECMPDDRHRPEAGLDVAILSEWLSKQQLTGQGGGDESTVAVRYYSDGCEAYQEARNNPRHSLLFLLNPTRVEQVLEVADAGRIMPHKSTYFYPKLVTGLVMYRLNQAVGDTP